MDNADEGVSDSTEDAKELSKPLDGVVVQPTNAVPPDGGWGWMVVMGAFYVAATLVGVLSSFGIIFSEPLTRMNVSSVTTGWMVNIYIFLWNMSVVLVPPLCEMFSWRSVSFFGHLIAAISYILMAFVSSVLSIFLLFSVGIGMGGGAATGVCLLVVPAYFEKHKGAAMAILMTGSTIGQIVLPIILTALSQEFGFKGSALIFGGILLNCCVSARLYHPIEWHQRKPNLNIELKAINTNRRPHNNMNTKLTVCYVLNTLFFKVCKQFRDMNQLRISLVNFSYGLYVIGYANFVAQLPFSMREAGYSAQTISYSFSLSAIANTVVRLLICLVTDRKWFNRKICFLVGTLLGGICSIAAVFIVDELKWLICSMIGLNIGTAAVLSVFYTLLLDIGGRELYGSAISLSGFTLAIVGITIGPFTGVVRNFSSYTYSLAMCGVMQLLSFLFLLLLPLAIKFDERRTNNK